MALAGLVAFMPASRHLNMTSLNIHGFVIVPGAFSEAHIDRLHRQVVRRHPFGMAQTSGIALVGLTERSGFDFVRELIRSHAIRSIADAVFADVPEGYRNCGPNGIGVNRIVGWHKDRLNGQYLRHQKTPLWGKGSETQGGHRIYKIGIYLDEYSSSDGALRVVPGSHLTGSYDTHEAIWLHPRKGDVLVWEQRITHRGMDKAMQHATRGRNRTLVQLGFGRNNIFTDEFERGTLERNRDHCANRCLNGEYCCHLPGMPGGAPK